MSIPITAPYDSDGVAIPSGWTATKTISDSCVDCVAPCQRVERVALSIPGLPYADPLDLGSQDCDLLALAWYRWDRYREMLQWLYQGQPFADSLANSVTDTSGNFSEPFDVRISAVDGQHVTIDPAYNRAHKMQSRLNILAHIQPGDMLRMGGCEALVLRADIADPNSVYIHKPIAVDPPLLARVYREIVRPDYPYPAPFRALWVEPHSTGWISSGTVVPGYTLRKRDGSNGRIAWPYARTEWRETFRVLAKTTTGQPVDVTALVLANFRGGAHWLSFEQTASGGAFHTALDLSALTLAMSYVEYRMDYCPEVADQADPGAGGVAAFRPAQSACRFALRDWSNSIRLQQDSVEVGASTDVNGSRWYCAYTGAITEALTPLIPSDIIAQFAPMCNLTRCPGHALNEPWRPSHAQIAALLLGRDKYGKRQGADPSVYQNGRAQQPGLHWLVGCPTPSHDTAQPPLDIAWYGVGGWGYLETTGLIKTIRSGAVDEAGEGVLAQATYPGKSDRAGGEDHETQAQYDDGSDWLEVESAHPSRRCGYIGMSRETDQAAGDCETAVQRVRRHPLIVPGIRVGANGTSPDGVAIAWDGDNLRLTIPALGATIGDEPDGRPFPVKAVQAIVHAAYMDSGLLWVEFLPGVVRTQSIGSGAQVTTWLAAGSTVSPPPWLEIRNPTSGERSRYQMMTERLCRGDTIRFPGLGGTLGDTRLTCVYAEAFGGEVYDGAGVPDPENPETIVQPSSTPAPNWQNVPEWYLTQLQRLAMDVAAFDVSGHLAGAIANSVGDIAGEAAVIDSAAAMPPQLAAIEMSQPSTGTVIVGQSTGYDLDWWHYADGEEQAAPTPYYDPANGVVDINAAGWDSGANHCIAATHYDDGGAPWRVTRENTTPAEIVTALQAAHETAVWCRSGNLLLGQELAIRSRFNWAIESYGIIPLSPNTVALRSFWIAPGEIRYTWAASYSTPRVAPDDVLPFAAVVAPDGSPWGNALKAEWDSYFQLQADGARQHSDGNFAWAYSGPSGWPSGDGVWIMRQDVSGMFRAGVFFGSDGGWDDPDIRGTYQAYKLEMTPGDGPYTGVPPLRRWRSDWIAEALIDLNISGATRYTRKGTYIRNPTTGAYESDPSDPVQIDNSGDLSITLALLAAEEYRLQDEHPPNEFGVGPSGDAVTFSPLGQMTGIEIAQANQGEWVTIDITALAKVAAEASAGRKVYAATLDADGALPLANMGARNIVKAVEFSIGGVPLTLVTEEPTTWTEDIVWYDEAEEEYLFGIEDPDGVEVSYTYVRDLYIAVTGAGDGSDGAPTVFETVDMQDLFYGSVSRWTREYGIYEIGTEASGGGVAAVKTSDAINSHWIEYEGVAFKDLKIRMNWEAYRNSADLPHIAYGPAGQAGEWPVDEVADLPE